jgi:hypothetical protein
MEKRRSSMRDGLSLHKFINDPLIEEQAAELLLFLLLLRERFRKVRWDGEKGSGS